MSTIEKLESYVFDFEEEHVKRYVTFMDELDMCDFCGWALSKFDFDLLKNGFIHLKKLPLRI